MNSQFLCNQILTGISAFPLFKSVRDCSVLMKDDPEDPERDIVSRLQEMKSRESILIIS